ncbi:MAG: hypothetical protein WA861_09525, partial [Candidatus Binatus sp.]
GFPDGARRYDGRTASRHVRGPESAHQRSMRDILELLSGRELAPSILYYLEISWSTFSQELPLR